VGGGGGGGGQKLNKFGKRCTKHIHSNVSIELLSYVFSEVTISKYVWTSRSPDFTHLTCKEIALLYTQLISMALLCTVLSKTIISKDICTPRSLDLIPCVMQGRVQYKKTTNAVFFNLKMAP
jgi:hypothetical protein